MHVAQPRVKQQWITSRNYDLFWYIGACISSYVLLYLNLAAGISALLLWSFWILSVDGPHIFGTISRTYLDTEERHQRARLLFGSLLWFLVGPLFLIVAIATKNLTPFLLFLTLAQFWAYWHIVRQHYGFLVLYQKKNGEEAGKQNKIDYPVFYMWMLLPFLSFLLRHPEARPYFGLAAEPSATEKIGLFMIHAAIIASVFLYLVKEIWRYVKKNEFNLPKNLFLLACVPLHFLIFLNPFISTRLDIHLFAVFVTFYHNIQYHGIVWFYNRNRYGKDSSGFRYGISSLLSRNFLYYYLAGLLFTLIYRSLNWYLVGGVNAAFDTGPESLRNMTILQLLVIGLWWGFAFNHYYLDQKIWKISKDKELTRDLKLA
jgi:hypothetical protein